MHAEPRRSLCRGCTDRIDVNCDVAVGPRSPFGNNGGIRGPHSPSHDEAAPTCFAELPKCPHPPAMSSRNARRVKRSKSLVYACVCVCLFLLLP